MSPLVTKVRQLEDKYAHNGKVSFLYVPDSECKKFYRYRDEYFTKQEKASFNYWNKYSKTKKYREAINKLLGRIATSKYTLEEITELFDDDPILSNHGRHVHEYSSVYSLLVKRGLKWRKRHASDHYTK
jgi:nuclear transport factor 2 (NTF2) superfamily protein